MVSSQPDCFAWVRLHTQTHRVWPAVTKMWPCLLLDQPRGLQHSCCIKLHFSSVNLCFPPSHLDLCTSHCCIILSVGLGAQFVSAQLLNSAAHLNKKCRESDVQADSHLTAVVFDHWKNQPDSMKVFKHLTSLSVIMFVIWFARFWPKCILKSDYSLFIITWLLASISGPWTVKPYFISWLQFYLTHASHSFGRCLNSRLYCISSTFCQKLHWKIWDTDSVLHWNSTERIHWEKKEVQKNRSVWMKLCPNANGNTDFWSLQ